MASFGGQHHDHGATFKFGVLLNSRDLFHFGGDLFQQLSSPVGQRYLATAKHDRDFNLVLALQELADMSQFGLQIMVAGLGPYLDFLYLESGLLFLGFLLLFGLFIFKAAVVHDFAHRRGCGGRNFDEIEAEFSSRCQGIVDGQYAKLFTVRIDDTDFPFTNVLVDSGALRQVIFCRSDMSYADTS